MTCTAWEEDARDHVRDGRTDRHVAFLAVPLEIAAGVLDQFAEQFLVGLGIDSGFQRVVPRVEPRTHEPISLEPSMRSVDP